MKSVVRVVGGVFYRRQSQIQVQLFRKMTGSIAGFFEFPGGKIERGETPEGALVREIREELGVSVIVQDFVGINAFEVSDRIIELQIYLMVLQSQANLEAQNFSMTDHDQILWLDENSQNLSVVAPGDLPLLPLVFEKIKTKI